MKVMMGFRDATRSVAVNLLIRNINKHSNGLLSIPIDFGALVKLGGNFYNQSVGSRVRNVISA